MLMLRKLRQNGQINILLIPLILISLFFVGAIGFGVYAFQGKQDYKNNVDAKVSVAVDKAVQAEDVKDNAQFAENYKKPLLTYHGPDAYGSVVLQYPRTWSGYVNETVGNNDLDGYFAPGVVPDIAGTSSAFALRIQVVNTSYSNSLLAFSGQVQSHKVTITPYSLPKVPDVVGSRVDGAVEPTKTGSMILLPLRDKTLKVWTNSSDFVPDFNNTILPNLTFSP